MAYAVNTLNGIIQLNDQNLSGVEGISDLFDGSSLVERIYAQISSQGGTVHKYLKQTVAARLLGPNRTRIYRVLGTPPESL